MTAGRERSAGQASLNGAARDRVSLRAGGRSDGSGRHFAGAYPGVDNDLSPLEAAIVFAIRRVEAQRRARLAVVMDDATT